MIAISTAYKEALIAVEINNKKAFTQLDANCKHSENILKSLNSLLEEQNLSIKDNDKFAVVVGPGSFTGIRIGIALVKGFVSGLDKISVLPLTTFDLMAYSYVKYENPENDFICVINALSGLYYICKYSKDGDKLGIEQLIGQKEFDEIGYTKVGLSEENIVSINVKPTSEDLLELAKVYDKKGLFTDDVGHLQPLYLRKSQAEDSLDKKIKKVE